MASLRARANRSLFPADRSLRAVDSVYVTADAVAAGKIDFLVLPGGEGMVKES
jgi:hypothetical protein